MINELKNYFCRICGLLQDDPPWGDDGKSPTYEICDCCGVEFGYQDSNLLAIRAFRESWLSKGANWRYPKEKPSNWSLEKQMENIPTEFN